jgi:hypothetical protein
MKQILADKFLEKRATAKKRFKEKREIPSGSNLDRGKISLKG